MLLVMNIMYTHTYIYIKNCSYLITPGGISSIWLGRLSPLRLVHLITGEGIPPVTRHWNNTLPPIVTTCLDCGYNSIVGASLPEIQHLC